MTMIISAIRRIPRALLAGVALFTYVMYKRPFPAPAVQEEEEEADERESSYITTGLITASIEVARAHAEHRDCNSAHTAVNLMLSYIDSADMAFAVIENLCDVLGPMMDEEEVAQIVKLIMDDETDTY